MSYMDTYKKWCTDNYFDEDTKKELLALQGNDAEIEDRFYRQLELGTGGLRGTGKLYHFAERTGQGSCDCL